MIRFLYGRPLETLLADLGHQPDPDAGRALALRRAERAGREPVVDVAAASTSCSNLMLPYNRHRDHRLRARGRARSRGAADRTHAPRPVRARRHAEPPHGRLRRREHGARRHATRSRSAPASPDSAAARCRRSATSAPTSARATSSTRSWWSCSAASASSPARCSPRSASGVLNKLLEGVAGRGAREDRGAGVHRHLHPEAAAGPVRDEGPERGGMRDAASTDVGATLDVAPQPADRARSGFAPRPAAARGALPRDGWLALVALIARDGHLRAGR